MTQAPAWVRDVAAAAARARVQDLTGFGVPPGGGRPGAVLLLFGEDGGHGRDVLLTERAASLRAHAGQVAFPGGAVDPGDGGPVGAALREGAEETGLDPAGVEVLGVGPELYLPVSDFVVTPVVGWWRAPSPVAPRAGEVARVVRVPLEELLDPANRFSSRHPSGHVGPAFRAGGLYVWGFTAGLLSRLLALAGLERPWDAGRLEPVPGAQLQLEDEPLEGAPPERGP